ncbi:iron transporter [Massilia sp. TN1-12]|uniref:iron transporter n=1 Tax=Massilia paldalensis TaxID=3377675 RepID=UPI00384FB38D
MHSIPSGEARAARTLPAHGLRYRAAVASRAVAAIGGGYLLATLCTRALALGLPMAPVDNVIAATLTGLIVYAVAAMWAFAAASASRAWMGLGVACALSTIVVLALRAAGVGA